MELGYAAGLGLSAVFAGVVGAMLGLGGGVIIVPLYTLGFGLPVHVAVGTSLVAVVANASTATTVYLKTRLTNVRLALILGGVTAAGALLGGFIGTSLSGAWLGGTFGALLLGVGLIMLLRPDRTPRPGPALAGAEAGGEGDLDGSYYDPAAGTSVAYRPVGARRGLTFSFLAGTMAGTLGIGGGVIQVPVMNLLLGLPMKAATATSSHIISLTAAAGAVVYAARGFVDPVITAVTIIGVIVGSRTGAWLAQVLPGAVIKKVFAVVLFYMALRMLAQAFGFPLF